METNSNKKYTASTDTELYMNMLADNTKLKIMPDIHEESNDFKITMSNNDDVDSPDSINIHSEILADSDSSDDLKFDVNINDDDDNDQNLIKADSEEFNKKKQLHDFKKRIETEYNDKIGDSNSDSDRRSYRNSSHSKSSHRKKKKKVNLKDINDIDDIPFHMLDERTKKFKRMEKYAQLITIRKSGIKLTKEYSIHSDYDEMCFEVEFWTNYQKKKDGVNLGKSFMLNAIQGIEFLNERYDPFGVKLKGWHDQVQISGDSYDSVFGELYDKYKDSGGKMAPEVKLVLMIAASEA